MYFNLYKFLFFAGFILPATAYAQERFGPQLSEIGTSKATCYYNDAGEFVLKGEFDTQARICFANTYLPGTDAIRINSVGGQNAVGLGLAHRLKGEDFHLIIEGQCNSACAQYIIPLARELTVEEGAGIIIHGVLSDHFLTDSYKDFFITQGLEAGRDEKDVHAEYKEFKTFTTRQIKAAEFFRRENSVKRGWYMQSGYWTEYDIDNPVKEKDVDWLNRRQTAGILIDRVFMESCLPDVKINQFYGPSDPQSESFDGYKARIKAANLTILPHAKCIG